MRFYWELADYLSESTLNLILEIGPASLKAAGETRGRKGGKI